MAQNLLYDGANLTILSHPAYVQPETVDLVYVDHPMRR
jgi:hypothetical protein